MTNLSAKTRLMVLQRDKHTCQRCNNVWLGHERGYDIHHIVPRRLGGTNEVSNLVTYCHKCHKLIEPRDERQPSKLITLSLNDDIVTRMDIERGDLPRSIYMRRLIYDAISKRLGGKQKNG